MTFSAIHFCQIEPTSKVIISSDVFRCNTEKGDKDGEEEEEEEEKRVEGLIPCFCRKYLGRARVTRLTERGCKKLLEALSLNAAQQVVDKCRLCRGKIEC